MPVNTENSSSLDPIYGQFQRVIACLIKALMSQSQVDRERAREELNACLSRCEVEISQVAFHLYPELPVSEHSLIRWTSRSVHHYELVRAECILMLAVLEGEITNFKPTRHAISTLFWSQLRLQSSENHDQEYASGVALAWGFLHLLSAVLSAEQSIILGLAELNAKGQGISNACSLISACLSNATIHGHLARLLLLYIHTHITLNAHETGLLLKEVMNSSISNGHNHSSLSNNYNDSYLSNGCNESSLIRPPSNGCNDPSQSRSPSMSLSEDSPLFIYFQARLLHIRSPTAALKLLLKHATLQRTLISCHLPIYLETIKCLAEHQRWNEALQYLRLVRVNAGTGQIAWLLYLEAVLIQAVSGRLTVNIKASPEINQIFREITRLPRGKSFLNQLAHKRASESLTFAPQYELLLLVWSRNLPNPQLIRHEIGKGMEEMRGRLSPEQELLGWTLLAELTEDPRERAQLLENHVQPHQTVNECVSNPIGQFEDNHDITTSNLSYPLWK